MGERNPTSSPQASACDYRRIVNSWAMYDWATSAFAVIILTAVFPVYYRALVTNAGRSPEDATAYWAYTNSASLLVIALVGPVLGAAADLAGGKMRMLKIALALGVLGSANPAFVRSRQSGLHRRKHLLRSPVAAYRAARRSGSCLRPRLRARLSRRRDPSG